MNNFPSFFSRSMTNGESLLMQEVYVSKKTDAKFLLMIKGNGSNKQLFIQLNNLKDLRKQKRQLSRSDRKTSITIDLEKDINHQINHFFPTPHHYCED